MTSKEEQQSISDYPLVETIAQNVVKHPVLPDAVSRAKLTEHKSPIVSEKYADYLALGVEEWRKSYAEHEKLGKKAVLFVMVDDTKNCDEVGAHLEKLCPELQETVLVIHTRANGEISEASSGKSKDEGGTRYGFVYVDQESFEQHKPTSFVGLVSAFREYQDQEQGA